MAEHAGLDTVIKVSGAATPFVGEATTAAGNITYQITETAKQVLDMTATIRVQKKGTDDEAESGTTTTNLKMTDHGLVAGDLIINATRSNAARLIVTKVDDNNVTVAAVTGQTTGDTIEVYKTEAATEYTLNRLNGKVTYPSSASRTIRISGSYLPMSVAAYCREMSHSNAADLLDTSVFGLTHKSKLAGLKSASGTLTHIDVVDTVFVDALTSGTPLVLEDRTAAADAPNRYWALIESAEMAAAIADVQTQSVSWTSKNEWIKLGG